MKNLLQLKPLIIAVLILLLCLPLGLIGELVNERHQLSSEVRQDIANASSRAQQISGPILLLETEHYRDEPQAGGTVLKATRQIRTMLPAELQVDTTLNSEVRRRGIYQSRLYHSQHQLRATFALPAALGFGQLSQQSSAPQLSSASQLSPAPQPGAVRLVSARFILAVSDVRGFNGMPQLTLDQQQLTILPGTGVKGLTGVQAPLDLTTLTKAGRWQLDVALNLSGTDQLSLLGAAAASQWQLTADWPHPGFIGRFLPQQRDINAKGFRAHWQSTLFSNDVQPSLELCINQGDCDNLAAHSFAVSLVEPVDHYQQSSRAVKYALMVLVVSFAVFYLFELLAAVQIHPMQYLFVGLALAMFYLLLLSLAEVIGFALAYLAASSCCITLLGVYTSAVLGSRAKAALCAAGLSALYALLYLILGAEDLALLAGSALMFLVLAGVMLSTRQLNWYQLPPR